MADKQRKSPLGYNEHSVDNKQAQELGLGPFNLAATLPNRETYYRDNSYNDPIVQQHERIHVGQFGLPQIPPLNETMNALSSIAPFINSGREITGDPKIELPAYAFQGNSLQGHDPQEAFNNYLNLVYKYNRHDAPKLEAQMPQELWHNYVKNVPRPILPPEVNMKEMLTIPGISGSGKDNMKGAGDGKRSTKNNL